MNNDRRDFIRKAGIGLLAGMGAASGILTGGGFERTTSAAWAVEPGDTGRRWGMLIDTRRCREGCTLCIESCHHTHNVPDVSSPAGTVEWMHKEDGRELLGSACPSTAALPALCNHCAEPSCARACPTDSIFRRTDGIVAIDYHRCVGCRSCMQGCPYGEVSFNWSDPRAALKNPSVDYPTRQRGVVEKCNFCSDRLARGKKPSCVEACPEGAISFGNINNPSSEIRRLLESNQTLQRKPELGTRPSVFYII
ncbi:MAG: 4Fe-4S dicluster domain-containing protein [Candidatus Chlorobium antarcticum]|nr:4Fe-4S dicluster domain-containing protein [Candidatus Chlorobium antarcticum]